MQSIAIKTYLNKNTKAASLAVFRVLFGLIMCLSIVRFWYRGWIEKLYLSPKFHFHYSGFEWVNVPGQWTYLIFILAFLSALMFAIGYKYKWAIVIFFLSFTSIELLDKSTYLNHYYFVSVMSFILIFLPANAAYSVDAHSHESVRKEFVPQWCVDVIKLMLAIVYIYAGLAKLNTDWMVNAMPLTIWLPSKFSVPVIGSLMHEKWMHYLFSWSGALYDLTIVFFLLWRKTRVFAFTTVIIFHILTRVLFPIGMFPYIMIASTFIFFSSSLHEKCLDKLFKFLKIDSGRYKNSYLKFSWRVMLMEKTAYANFKIVDGQTGKRFYVQNDDFLTSFQEKQMATQPDFILEFAHFLGAKFKSDGHENIEVYVESYASLNGRQNQQYIDPNVDLMHLDYDALLSKHIIPLK